MRQESTPHNDSHYVHPDKATNEALDWYMSLHDESVDAQTWQDFTAWRQRSPANDLAYRQLEQMYSMPSLYAAAEIGVAEVSKVKKIRSSPVRQGGFGARFGKIAAILFIALVGLYQLPDMILHFQSDYMTAKGEIQKILLPDGSYLILNTESAVALKFNETERHVRILAGEAYFNVIAGDQRPFLVQAGNGAIEDFGTSFAVWRTEDRDHVFLETGAVGVRHSSIEQDLVMLKPGQQVNIESDQLSAITLGNAATLLAWKQGKIVFQNTPLKAARDALRRYYPGKIWIMGSGLEKAVISGSYNTADPAQALRIMAAALGRQVMQLPGDILILR